MYVCKIWGQIRGCWGRLPHSVSCIAGSPIGVRKWHPQPIFFIYAFLLNKQFPLVIHAFVTIQFDINASMIWTCFLCFLNSSLFEILTETDLQEGITKPQSTMKCAKGPFIYYVSTFWLINCYIFSNFLSNFLYVLKMSTLKLQQENIVKM